MIGLSENQTPIVDRNLDVAITEGSKGTFTLSGENLATWYANEIPAFKADGKNIEIPGGVAWSVDASFTPPSTLSALSRNDAFYQYRVGSSFANQGFIKGTIVREYGGSVTAENVTGGYISGYVDFSGRTVPGTGALGDNRFTVRATSPSFYATASYGTNGVAATLNNDGSFALTKAHRNTTPGGASYRSGIGLGNASIVRTADLPDNMDFTGQIVGSTGKGITGVYAIDRNGSDGNWAAFGVTAGSCAYTSGSSVNTTFYCP